MVMLLEEDAFSATQDSLSATYTAGMMQIPPESLMSCGDGSNDLQLVANSGIGIAMGNAVPAVKEAAHTVVASNDDGGIAEAIDRFILS